MCVYIGRAERRPLRRVVLLAALASADVFCYSSILRNLKYYFAARDAWRRAVEGERQCGVVSLVCGRSESSEEALEHVATTMLKVASELVAVFYHHRPSDTPPPASLSCDNGRRRELLRVVL